MKRLEIGSWRVWELWVEEWPKFKKMLGDYRGELKKLWLALRNKLRTQRDGKRRSYVREVAHQFQNCVTELVRLIGRGITCFAYSIAHVLSPLILIAMIVFVAWLFEKVLS